MNVRLLGIEVRPPRLDEPGVTFNGVLRQFNGVDFDAGDGVQRRAYWQVEGEQLLFVVVTIRNQERFTVMQEQAGVLVLTSDKVGQGRSLIESNFGVLNLDSWRGLYSWYQASCSASGLERLLRQVFRAYIEQQRANEGEVPERRNNSPCVDLIVRQENFAELLRAARSVKQMTYSFAVAEIGREQYRALRPFLRSSSHKLSFSRDANVDQVKDALLRVVDGDRPAKLSVLVEDADGHDLLLHLAQNAACADQRAFDDFLSPDPVRPDALEASREIRTIREALGLNPLLYTRPA